MNTEQAICEDDTNQEKSELEAGSIATVAVLKSELENMVKNREGEIKTMNTGRNVAVSNSNQVTKSKACAIQ